MSLIGKVTVVNSLVVSLFVYQMQVQPTITAKYIDRFNNMVIDFIWNGRKPKIKLEILQQLKKQGGLCLVNLESRDNALKVAWVK